MNVSKKKRKRLSKEELATLQEYRRRQLSFQTVLMGFRAKGFAPISKATYYTKTVAP